METNNQAGGSSWLHSVLTDIQFWVPVAVLIGGLLLLHSLH
jgi:lipopolysaccharide export LptBFGC system permease protein LptF